MVFYKDLRGIFHFRQEYNARGKSHSEIIISPTNWQIDCLNMSNGLSIKQVFSNIACVVKGKHKRNMNCFICNQYMLKITGTAPTEDNWDNYDGWFYVLVPSTIHVCCGNSRLLISPIGFMRLPSIRYHVAVILKKPKHIF